MINRMIIYSSIFSNLAQYAQYISSSISIYQTIYYLNTIFIDLFIENKAIGFSWGFGVGERENKYIGQSVIIDLEKTT